MPWRVYDSDSSSEPEKALSVDDAKLQIKNRAKNSDAAFLVIIHNVQDRPAEAFAVKGGSWRNLNLIAKHPVSGERNHLYDGGRAQEGVRPGGTGS
jgi:hypothetical protein